MARQRRAGGGVDRLPSGRYRVRIVTADGRRVSLGSHPTRRAAEAVYARSLTERADGTWTDPSRTLVCDPEAVGEGHHELTRNQFGRGPRSEDRMNIQALEVAPCADEVRRAKLDNREDCLQIWQLSGSVCFEDTCVAVYPKIVIDPDDAHLRW